MFLTWKRSMPILLVLGVLIVAVPTAIPGLTIPHDGSTSHMEPMPGMSGG